MMSNNLRLSMILLLMLSLFVVACAGATPEVAPEPEAPAATEVPAEEEPAEEEPAEEEPAEEEPTEEEAAAEEEAAGGEATAYKIGFISAITGPGSGLGVPERNTAEMIAKELAKTGITGPDGVQHDVEVIILDSESNPDTAASNASRLITEEEVDVLVAGSLSGNAMAMVPIATESNVPMIGMASAGAIVKNPDTGEAREWIFKIPHENAQVAQATVIYLDALGITSVCHLYENSGYGQDTLNQVTTVFEEAGIEILYTDTFERTDTEFPQIVSLQGAGCEAVTIGAIPPGASMVHAAIIDAMPDMPVIQGSGVCNQQFIELAPEAVEGSIIPCTPLVAGESLPDSAPQKELVVEYLAAYREATGEETNQFGGIAYDAMQWAITGLSSLEDGLSLEARRAGIRDGIEGGVKDWAGTSGLFTLTPDDHLGLDYTTAFAWVRIEDGKYVYTTPEEWGGVSPVASNDEASGEAATGETGTAYKIGFISAVTGPGSGLGVPERNTADIIAKELAETGIVGPDGVTHEVEIIMLDSESNPDTAASSASRLITEEEVDVLVAGSLSGNAMAMVPIATESNVPMIGMASAGAIVKNPDTGEAREWIFKIPHENAQVAQATVVYLEAQGITSVCHLYENSGYGQDTLNQVTTVFEEAGIEILYTDTFERTDTEFPQIVSLQGAGCEAVTIGAIPPGASMVHAAIIDAMPDMPVIQGSGVCNQQFIELAPEAVEGSIIPCTPLVAGESLPDSAPQKQLILDYLAAYREATGEETNQFGGIGYDALQWAITGLSSLEEGLSLEERRAGVRDGIEGGVKDWAGTSGTFTLTPDDHLGLDYSTAFVWVRIENGKYVYTTPEEWGGVSPASSEGDSGESAATGEVGTAYKIGFISAVTGPGSGLGVPERNTADIIAAELAETGIVGPDGVTHDVEIITLDSESNPDTAASSASRLITEEEVDVLVAGSLSGNAMAMVPIATESNVPMVGMASAGAIVKNPDTGEAREWIFKIPHENAQVAQATVVYLEAQGITSVCHLYENSGYGQDTLNQVTTVFEAAGIDILYTDTFERTDTEFPQIVSLQGAGCEAVTIGAIPPGASMVHAAIIDAMPDMPVIQGSGVCNQQFIELAPEAVEGSVIPCTPLVAGESLPDSAPQKQLVLDYLAAYREATGEETNQFGGIGHDALQWAIIGLSSLEEGLSLEERRAGIRDGIEGGVTDWAGTSGTFSLTPDDHLGLEYTTAFVWVRVENGEYVYYPPEAWE